MKVEICNNEEQWRKKAQQSSFFDSWKWGEFQREAGQEPIRLCVGKEVVQGFVHKPIFGVQYVYFPRFSLSDACIPFVLEYLKKEKFVFVRIELGHPEENCHPEERYHPEGNCHPCVGRDPVEECMPHAEGIPAYAGMTKDAGMTRGAGMTEKSGLRSGTQDDSAVGYRLQVTGSRQPQHTLMLNLKDTEENLLKQMHSKTRYNIRLAEKKGVEVRNEKDIHTFWTLNEQTSARDKFKTHGKQYYARMLALPFVHQLTAYYEGKAIASNIVIIYNETAIYLHGASSNEFRNVMAPYALQWAGMKLAKEQGCSHYDFWGIAAPGDTKKSHQLSWDDTDKFSSITRFKAGFGGERVSYPDAGEVVLRPALYRIVVLLKRVNSVIVRQLVN